MERHALQRDKSMHIIPLGENPVLAVRSQSDTRSVPAELSRSYGIITSDPHMQWILHLAQRLSRTNLAVLITGQTGTGKELVAKMIHQESSRATKPFIAQNCPAIPGNLLESEMFGFRKGAFTSAVRDRHGIFELADGGTIFLDEVAELPTDVQPKLLRVIEEGEVWPLGAERPHHVNVRLIAATNRDLETEVKAGRFREDLFYRLSVFPISLPPLRSRRGDIPLLVEHFVADYAEQYGRVPPDVSFEVLDLLKQYPFSGNIRELKNLIARAVFLMDEGSTLMPEHFPGLNGSPMQAKTFREQVREFKVRIIHEALDHEGSMGTVAKRLGMSRRNLYKLCRRLGLAGLKGSSGEPKWRLSGQRFGSA